MTSRGRKRVFFSLFFGLYCTVFTGLLVWINALSPHPLPQINTVKLLSDGKTLQIKGNHLDHDVDAVLIPTTQENNAIIAKKFTWGDAYDIKIVKNIAWVANHTKGLIAYDISDPAHPFAISSLSFSGHQRAWSLSISENFCFIASSKDGLYIADIKDPYDPKIIAHMQLPSFTQSIAINEQLAVVASGKAGLHILDISDKTKPKVISHLDLDGYMNTISTINNLAFISGKTKEGGVTYIIDFSIPQTPKCIKFFLHKSTVWDNRITGKWLLCGTWENVEAIDLTLSLQDQTPQTVISGVPVTRLFDIENQLYIVSRHQRIYQYNMTDDFSFVTGFELEHRPCRAMDRQGHYGFIANGALGWSIIDLNSQKVEKNPSLLSKKDLKISASFLIEKDKIIIVNNDEIKLGYLTKNHSDYRIEKVFNLPSRAFSCVIKRDTLYFSVDGVGICTLNFDDHYEENNFKVLLPFTEPIRSLLIKDDILYFCVHKGFVLRVPLTKNDCHPEIFIKERAQSILFENNFIYLAKKNNGLSVYRWGKDDSMPEEIGGIDYPERIAYNDFITEFFRIENFLFLGSSKEILSIDITNPEGPRILDSIEFSERCRSIQTSDNVAYINHIRNGLSLIDLRDPHLLKELCVLPELDEFYVGKEEIATLDQLGNLGKIKKPKILTPERIKDCTLNFHLPRPDQEGDFDLFLSDVNTTKSIKKALSYTRKSGWHLNTNSANKQLHSEQSGGI